MTPQRVRLTIITIATVLLCGCEHEQEPATPEPATNAMREQLERILAATSAPESILIEYNDIHSFHGGKRITVTGNTLNARYLLREGTGRRQVDATPTAISGEQQRALLELLLELEVWEQRIPEREAAPDESRASLSVSIDTVESHIWEWFNDLSGNDRIIRIRHLLEDYAGPAPGT